MQYQSKSRSKWNELTCAPINQFLCINGDHNEIWIVSKYNDLLLRIFNYNVADNKFSKYQHKMEKKAMKVLTASFDKKNKVLYIINLHEIIIIHIKTNEHAIIPHNINGEVYGCCCIAYDGQLHIVGVDDNTSYYIFNNKDNIIECVYEFEQIKIAHPQITYFNISHHETSIDKRIEIADEDEIYYYTESNYINDEEVYSWGGTTEHSLILAPIFKHLFVKYDTADNAKYTLFFKDNAIIIHETIELELNGVYRLQNLYFYSNITLPTDPTHCILCKQSLKEKRLLSIGYIKRFIKCSVIPLDVVSLITDFYLSYNVHVFDENGEHYNIPIDDIINDSQTYTGTIKSYNKTNKSGMIQIKGKINQFYQRKYPVVNGLNHNKPTNAQKALVIALTNMFKQFAKNDDNTMSIEDMQKYILHCGATEESASTERVQSIFSYHGESDKKLSLKGFVNFYVLAIIDRPQNVVDDLEVFGYDEEELFKPNGECIHGLFFDYQFDDRYRLVDFDVIITDDGTKYAVNITKINAGYQEYID